MHRPTALAVLSVVVLLAAGCGGSETDSAGALPDASISTEPATEELAGDIVVFVWSETGGCAMGGPNCARYEVTVDGTVSTTRVGVDIPAGPEAAGQVDPALVQAWRDAVAAEDLEVMRERVGEGVLTAAFDGVDFTLSNPVTGVELSSVATAFDASEPVFATAIALATAASAAAPLEFEMR